MWVSRLFMAWRKCLWGSGWCVWISSSSCQRIWGGKSVKVGCIWQSVGWGGRQQELMEEWLGSTQGGWQRRQATFQKYLWAWWGKATTLFMQSEGYREGASFRGAHPDFRPLLPHPPFSLANLESAWQCGVAPSPSQLGEAQSAATEVPPINPPLSLCMPMNAPSAAQPAQLSSVVAGPCAGCSAWQIHSSSCPACVDTISKVDWTQKQSACFPRLLFGT